MSEVFAARYLAGLFFPWIVEKPALVPNTFKRGRGLPRAYLAIKLESRYTNTNLVYLLGHTSRAAAAVR